MSRADISGQYAIEDVTKTWCTPEKPLIEREVTFSTDPYNWIEFCDSVDAQLASYENVRSKFKNWGSTTVVIGFLYFILALMFRFVRFSIVVSVLAVIVFIYVCIVLCFASKTLLIWNKIKKICQEESGNGIRYKLKTESFGECVICTRRYFIMIHHVDEVEQGMPVATAVTVVDDTPSATASLPFAKDVSNLDLTSLEPVPMPSAPPAPTATDT